MNTNCNLEELSTFRNFDENVCRDFLNIAVEYLDDNVKNKAYSNASQKLDIEPGTVSSIIEKLAYLLLESEKFQLSEDTFHQTLEEILPKPSISLLWKLFHEKKGTLKQFLQRTKPQYKSYSSLDWRLECLLASRSLQQQKDINIFISLNFKDKEVEKQKTLCCDIPNLIHMTNILESALNETRSSHVRRVQRSSN